MSLSSTLAQVGGRQTFEFLRVPTDAGAAGWGGANVSTGQSDANAFWRNPALMSDSAFGQGTFSYIPWHADIHNFTLAYVSPFRKKNALGLGLYLLNYGKIPETDATGQLLGTFQASDFAFNVAYSFAQAPFRFGANFKFLGSQLAGFNAYALALDLGATFQHPRQDFTLGLVIKNAGFALRRHTSDASAPLPFDVQIGTSFKPLFMPLRFSATLHHLYRWDIVYLDPNRQTQLDPNGNPVPDEKTFFDKLARHFVLSAELLLSKAFQINVGYNHLINREMRIEGLGGLRGLSFGFDLRTRLFALGFARGTYHLGEGRNFFTLRINTRALHKQNIRRINK
ncbi:MAG: type IX secretion system protein PorQ [Microscillaceae bacterium]|nr:type IX secretion system protein PorQ [Microscillaceae bacterium]